MTEGIDKGVAPSAFCDKISLRPRATPDAWLIKDGFAFFLDDDDGFAFFLDDDDGARDTISVADGEIVDFRRLIEWPAAHLTIGDRGSWFVDMAMPADAENVMIEDDPDSMAGSLEDLVSFGLDPGDQVGVIYYAWREEKWRFDAATGKFAQILPAAEH